MVSLFTAYSPRYNPLLLSTKYLFTIDFVCITILGVRFIEINYVMWHTKYPHSLLADYGLMCASDPI